jgi:hypothetical protein
MCKIPNKYIKPDSNYTIDNPLFNQEQFYYKFIIADLIVNIINFGEIFFYLFMFFMSKKFPYKKDYFLFFKENFLILIVWLFFNDVLPFINLWKFIYYYRLTEYINNFLRIFCLFLVFTYLFYERKKIRTEKFIIVINDFNRFINFPPFFKYFQDHLEKYHENSLKLLDFWISFNILQNKIYQRETIIKSYYDNVNSGKIGNMNNSNLAASKNNITNFNDNYNTFDKSKKRNTDKLDKDIKDKVFQIYNKYFNSSRFSSNFTETSSSSQFKIEFPIDMQEKVEEIIGKYNHQTEPSEIFEESFNFVCHHLSNIHGDLIIKEREKLISMLYVINFFDLDDQED